MVLSSLDPRGGFSYLILLPGPACFRLQILEMTEKSASTLHAPPTLPSEGAAARSQYKSSKPKTHPSVESTAPANCKWCGKSEHPGGKSLDRANCAARNKNCLNCGIKGHLASVCLKSKSNAASGDSVQELDHTESIPSGASVSFSFSAQQDQDFRRARKHEKEPWGLQRRRDKEGVAERLKRRPPTAPTKLSQPLWRRRRTLDAIRTWNGMARTLYHGVLHTLRTSTWKLRWCKPRTRNSGLDGRENPGGRSNLTEPKALQTQDDEFMNSSRQAANTQVPLYFTTISLLFFKFHNSEAVKISEGYSEKWLKLLRKRHI